MKILKTWMVAISGALMLGCSHAAEPSTPAADQATGTVVVSLQSDSQRYDTIGPIKELQGGGFAFTEKKTRRQMWVSGNVVITQPMNY
ncbi:hypothetical protein [Paraburkholderia sp. BCC1886]|uniref:hypothetical protein n=1 Tax=Paraburkholderia sp. BCC1886 TaxID=2562670 RepID=UPI0011828340|nr:hypothetical protein [Paraburkholderia sp. BCC1886]